MGRKGNKPKPIPNKVLEDKKAKTSAKRSKTQIEDDDFEDEVDIFNTGANKISLTRKKSEESDSEAEPVMNLDVEDEEDDEEEFYAPNIGGLDEDDDENEEDEEEGLDNKWGGRKKAYYETDVIEDNKDRRKIDFEREDAMKDEEEEAIRLQKKKASTMSAQDFDDEALVDDADQADEDEESFGAQLKRQDKKKGKKKNKESSESSLVQAMQRELDAINFDLVGDEGTVVEQVTKDASGLSKEEKLEIIINDSPELLELLEEFKNNVTEIKQKLQPFLQRVKNGELPTSKGVSYLEVKYHLLLSYCTNISFYLMLKAEGKSVKDHPVIDQIVRIRTILEKLKPLDKKLSYQINKLLQQTVVGEEDNDPRSFRPNPELLEANDEDVDAEDAGNETYKVPKLSEMHFEERSSKMKRLQDLQRRAERSKIMKDIQLEFGDAPEELEQIGATKRLEDQEERDRTQYEEDMYIRLNLTKEQKHKRKSKLQNQFRDEIEALTDFGDAAALEKKEDVAAGLLQKKAIKNVIAELKHNKTERFKGGDMDLPYKDSEQRKRKFDDDYDVENNFGGFDDYSNSNFEEDEFYEEVKQKMKKPKGPKERFTYQEDFIEDGEKRGVSSDISSNRGLTRARPKDVKNPRAKHRTKYEKALKKKRGRSVKTVDTSRPYGGERTGIKANVKRSVGFKY